MVQDVASADHSELRDNRRLESLLARISETVGPVRCELWFGEPGTVVWDEAGVQFRFASEFEMNRVVRQHGTQLRQAVESLAGSPIPVRFTVHLHSAGLNDMKPVSSSSDETADPANALNRSGGDLAEATEKDRAGEATGAASPEATPFAQVEACEQLLPASSAGDFGRALPKAGDAAERRTGEPPVPGINGVRARVQASGGKLGRSQRAADEPVGSTDNRAAVNKSTPSRSTPTSSTPTSSTLRRGHSLESFWFGPENQLLETAIRENFRGTGHFSPLLIYGPTGSGKSHLLEAICRRFRAAHSQRRCVCLTAEEFLNEFVYCLKKSGLPMFRRKFRDLDLLAIDDVHFLAGKTATVNELNITLGQLVREGKQVILTTERQPQELSQLSQELMAHLHGGLNCPLRYPSLEGRRRILEMLCEQRGWKFAAEVLELVAQGIDRDSRRLAGALNRLRAAELATGRAATRESAQRDLCDLISVGETVSTLPRIEKLVCEACGIPPAQLRSDSRTKKISSARMLAMWLSRRHTSNALSEIGDYFGGRSHSTVVAAEKRVQQWLEAGGNIELENGVVPVSDAVQLLARRLRVG